MTEQSGKKPKRKNYIPSQQQWDVYKKNSKPGHIIDGRSGEGKFIKGGRKRDIPLDKLDSYEDKKIEEDLMRRWRAGEFGEKPPEHFKATKSNTKPKKKIKGKKK